MAGRLTSIYSSYGINALRQKVTIATALSGRQEKSKNLAWMEVVQLTCM